MPVTQRSLQEQKAFVRVDVVICLGARHLSLVSHFEQSKHLLSFSIYLLRKHSQTECPMYKRIVALFQHLKYNSKQSISLRLDSIIVSRFSS